MSPTPAHDEDGGTVDLETEDVYLSDGTRLTEEVAERIVEEVHAKRGRPSLSAPGVRSPQLRIAIPAELQDQLQEVADSEGRSVSVVARDALAEYVKRHRPRAS